MKKIFPLLLLVFFISFLASASAGFYWYQEGGADQNYSGSTGYTYYSTNANSVNNATYGSCTFDGSNYQLLSANFDGVGVTDYLATKNNKLVIYDIYCNVLGEITLENPPSAMPNIIDYDSDAVLNIMVLTSIGVQSYVDSYIFNTSTSNIERLETWNLTAMGGHFALSFMSCNRWAGRNTCLFSRKVNNTVISLRPDNGALVTSAGTFTTTPFNLGINYNGYSNTRTSQPADNFLSPMCNLIGATTNDLRCQYVNESGEDFGAEMKLLDSESVAITNFNYLSAGIVKQGGNYKNLVHIEYNKTGGIEQSITQVWDTSSTKIFDPLKSGNELLNKTSNWVFGDVGKSGENNACYLINDSTDNNIYFRCWELTFSLKTADHLMTDIINITHNLVMGEFYNDYDLMCLGNIEGIYCFNSTWSKTDSTGIDISRDGTAIITSSVQTGTPAYAYSDSTLGFIFSSSFIETTCGDGVCEGFENPQTCEIDCGIAVTENLTGDPCETNSNCKLGVCELGYCKLAVGRQYCDQQADCLSGVCRNNLCTKAGLWRTVDDGKTQNFGDDNDTNNFLAITLMLIISGMIIAGTRSFTGVLISSGAFIVLAIFFTIVGWLSAFILLGIFIVMLIIGFLLVVLGGGGD